jgi:hypothetical protein
MTDLIFDTPWWLPTLIALVGVILFVRGNRRQQVNVRTAGVSVIGLAFLLAAVSYFVDTDKEKVQKRTRQLVQSVEKGDWKVFESLLEPQATLTASGLPWYVDRAEIVGGARSAADRVGLKGVSIASMKTERDGEKITSHIKVFSVQDETAGRPLDSEWEFDWLNAGQGWQVSQIREIAIHNLRPEQVQRELPKHK